MKQGIRKISLFLIMSMLLAVILPMSAQAAGKKLALYVDNTKVKKIEIAAGEKVKMTVKYDGSTLKKKASTYVSSDEAIAKVSKKGVIRGVSEGEAVITVTYLDKTKKLKVTVGEGDGTEDSSSVGELTLSAKKTKTGQIITVTLDKKAKKHDWTWTFTGTAAKDARVLEDNSKKKGKLTFTVWPSGGTVELVGTDPQGLTITSKTLKVKRTKKWKKRDAYRTAGLAGITADMTQAEMVVHFADYIADNGKYGSGKGNFFRLIDEGEGDCWCYSTAFKLLADAVGIETTIVKNGGTRSHYWNQVKINDVWYNVDVQGYDLSRGKKWILSSDDKHGWYGHATFYNQYSIHYPVSPAQTCTKSLKF